MANQHTVTHDPHRGTHTTTTGSSGGVGMGLILGAIVVALLIGGWFIFAGTNPGPGEADTTVNITAPQAPAGETVVPPSPEPLVPQAETPPPATQAAPPVTEAPPPPAN